MQKKRAHADILTVRLCSPVDPSIRYQPMYTRVIDDVVCHLRLVYVADDDLVFFKRCAHGLDEAEAANHKQPYLSIAKNSFSQAFILDRSNEPVGVAEVHNALYLVDEEWEYKTGDYLIRFFWPGEVAVPVQVSMIRFFAGYCHLFPEVKRLLAAVKEGDNGQPFARAGFARVQPAGTTGTVYYVLTLEEPA